MVKKQNHKIFNLIVMIISILLMFCAVSFSSYADEAGTETGAEVETEAETEEEKSNSAETVYSTKTDYVEEDEYTDVEEDKSGSMWTSVNTNNFFQEVRANVAKWYYLLRYIAIAVMLVILVFLAIKLAFASLAPKKALYKRMLLDWVACFALVFFSHYFMIFIQFINENLIDVIKDVSNIVNTDGKYDLYETVKSRAYDIRFTVGFTGMILYMTLVYLTAKYVYIYAKRFLLVIILTITAPISILLYSIQKILRGKSKMLSKWMEEYAINVLLQSVHAIMYAVFIGTALKLTETSLLGVVLSMLLINFMSKADKLFRNIFKFTNGSSMADEISNSQLSEIKDGIGTAVGVGIVASKTGVAKSLGNATAKALRFPAGKIALLASDIKASDMYKNHVKNREEKAEKKSEKYDKEINKAQGERENLEKRYNDNKASMNDADRRKLEDAIEKAKAKERKKWTKKQSYNYRRGLFERIRDTLDPDNYLEYDDDKYDYVVYDEDEFDEDGNLIHSKGEKVLTPEGDELVIRKRRLLKSEKIYNAETEKFEKIGGVRKKAFKKIDNLIGLTSEHKKLIKEAKQMIKDEVLGFGGLLLGMGTFIDNPALGFAMLAVGANSMRRNLKQDDEIKMDRKTKRAIKKIMKRKTKEYKNAQFTTGSILSIDKIIKEFARTDIDEDSVNNLIWKIKTNNLSYFIPTIPFTLTGTKGIMYNGLKVFRKIVKQNLQDIKTYERTVDVELMKAISKKISESYKKMIKKSAKHIVDRETVDIVEEIRFDDGTFVTTENNITFAFNSSENREVLSKKAKMRKVLVDVALKNNIYDLNYFDLENEDLKKDLIEACIDKGLLEKKDRNNYYEINKLLFGTIIDEDERDSAIEAFINENEGMSYTDIVKKSNEIAEQVGVKGIISIILQQEQDVLKKKVFEKVVNDYITTHKDEIKSKSDLLKARKKLMKFYQQELKKDSLNKKLVSIVAKQNSNFSSITSTDIITHSSQSDINQFKRSMIIKIRLDPNTTIRKSSEIDSETFDKVLNYQIAQLNGTFDNIILSVLASHGITDAGTVDLNNTSSNMQSIRSSIITLLRKSGLDNNQQELIAIAESRLQSITTDEIENVIISQIVSNFISEKCDGDPSRIQNDPNLEKELSDVISAKYDEMHGSQSSEEQESVEEIIELLRSNNRDVESIQQSVESKNNFMFNKVEDENIDPDLDLSLPFPIVKSELVNDVMVCTFSNPPGFEDLKLETCIITEGTNNYQFVENIDIINIDDKNKFALARLIRNGKHGPTLKINYPQDAIDIVGKIQDSIKNSEDDGDAENISNDFFDNLYVFDENSSQEEKVGSEVVEASQDDEISQLLKSTRVVQSNNRFQDIISEIQSMKPKVMDSNEENRNNLNGQVKQSIFEMDYAVGGADSFDSDDDFDDYRASTTELLRALLEMKAVDEDADSLKMNKDSKNNKKFKETKREIKEFIGEFDIQEIINSMYSKI